MATLSMCFGIKKSRKSIRSVTVFSKKASFISGFTRGTPIAMGPPTTVRN